MIGGECLPLTSLLPSWPFVGPPKPTDGSTREETRPRWDLWGTGGAQAGTEERGPRGSVQVGPSKWGHQVHNPSRVSPRRPGAW